MRVLLLLVILTTTTLTACAARTGTATIIYRDGNSMTATGVQKPKVGEFVVLFDSDGKLTITPLGIVFGVYWIEE